jgi:bile acid:Na+ symporter, BASS family
MFATDVLLPLALAVIMITLGLGLVPADFRRVIEAPRGIAIGLTNLFVVSPLLALGAAALFDLDPVFAVGLVLLGASPGGALANLLTHLARGEVALSVSMTALSSVAALVTVPFWLATAIDHFGSGVEADVNMAGVVVKVFAITIVPLAIGMTLRARRPERVAAIYDTARRVALAMFVLVVVVAIVSEGDRAFEHFWDIAAAALALNVAAMAISFTVARAARLPERSATAIAMELGLHNSTLAITVAASIDTRIAIPAAVYSMFMFVTAGLFARVMARRATA